jgi:glycosyltransferase involved in cell wall biosynthesis
MRIMHVLDSFELGGLETMVLALAAHQKREGHDVSVVAITGKHELFAQAESLELRPHTLLKRSGHDFFKTTLSLRAVIKKRNIEVIHSHNVVPHYFSAFSLFDNRTIALLNTRHDLGELFAPNKGDYLYRLAMRRSQFGIAVCDTGRQTFIRKNAFIAEKSRTVVNGINLENFKERNPLAKKHLLQTLNLFGDPLVFGTIGMLRPVKDHRTMLSAFARFKVPGKNAVLVIVGDGVMMEDCKKITIQLAIEDSVFFLGKRSDTQEILQGFDVFLQSSITEGYSLALVEAAAAGLPLIATNVGGNADIVRENINGLTVQAGDVIGYSEALELLWQSTERRETFGANARAWALQNGSIDTMYQKYLDLYLKAKTIVG